MTAKIEIDMDNATFQGANGLIELGNILEEIAANLKKGNYLNSLYDFNGNNVGKFTIEE